MLQYPAKEADRSVKPVSSDSLGALPRCSTNHSMDSSHRCESHRYFARVSELAYERHSECRAHMGLRVRIAPRAPPIPFRIDEAIYRPMRSSIQCVLVSTYALESIRSNRKLSQLPTTRKICIIDRRRLTRQRRYARVAEPVDATDSKSVAERHAGSNPASGTIID